MKSIEIKGDNYVGSYQRIRLACRAIVVKDDMILLSYEKNTNQFMIPGGGLEIGESEECCVKREVEEETGFLLDVDECVLEIHEYYGDERYISKYFLGRIVGDGAIHLTAREIEVGMEPRWIKREEALRIFSSHESFRDIDEMRRGLYLREYTALKAILK